MERRCSVRIPLSLRISIYYGPVGWFAARVRNVSADGASLLVADVQLPVNAPIILVVECHSGTDNVRLNWAAMVVRVINKEVAVMSLERDGVVGETLRWIIEQSLGAPASMDAIGKNALASDAQDRA